MSRPELASQSPFLVKEEIDEAYEFAQAWAEERLSKERAMIDASRKGSSNPF